MCRYYSVTRGLESSRRKKEEGKKMPVCLGDWCVGPGLNVSVRLLRPRPLSKGCIWARGRRGGCLVRTEAASAGAQALAPRPRREEVLKMPRHSGSDTVEKSREPFCVFPESIGGEMYGLRAADPRL